MAHLFDQPIIVTEQLLIELIGIKGGGGPIDFDQAESSHAEWHIIIGFFPL